MPSISLPVALGATAVAGLGGAALSANAAGNAAKTQANAAQTAAQQQASSEQAAINAQLGMFNTLQTNLAPYNASGQNALSALQYGLGLSSPTQSPDSSIWQTVLQQRPDVMAAYNSLDAQGKAQFSNNPAAYASYWYTAYGQPEGYQLPSTPAGVGTGTPGAAGGSGSPGLSFGSLNPTTQLNQQQLAQTPGYQFQLQQGLDQLQNQKSATGGVLGGNALKGIQQYAQGLAGTTYQQQFNNQQSAQQQQVNNLLSLISGGQSAAAGVGSGALSTGQGIGSNLVGAGNALAGGTTGAANANAAGTIGGANALGSGFSGISNNFLTAALLGQGGGGGSSNYQLPVGWENGPVLSGLGG